MEIVVTSAEMRACDRFAIDVLKIPGIILMENAGRGVAELMEQYYGPLRGKSALIFCGKGNNGGDGFVVARHCINRGLSVNVLLTGKVSELKGDAKSNYLILKKILETKSSSVLRIFALTSKRQLSLLHSSDFIVDALYGTGFSGKLKGISGDAVKWANLQSSVKISIDIPSGMNGDTGEVAGTGFRADHTVTMGLKKTGLILGKAKDYTGNIEVVDIGVRQAVNVYSGLKTYRVNSEDVRAVLPRRPLNAHKHSVGKILVLAGSRGLTGAAAMTSLSAMRAGAGAVVLGTPQSIYPILARKLTEVMVEPLPETSEGTLSLGSAEMIAKHLEWSDLVILGPGLSRNLETIKLVQKLVAECNKSFLIDADGLNAFVGKVNLLKQHKSKSVILTPHTGELSRLIGLPADDIERNRIEIARKTAKEFKLTVVLKGAPTVTADQSGNVFINSTGNPGMATAGSGDVLSGVIGGLWAQGMDSVQAAFSGVFLHGLAGDIARRTFGEKSMMATDLQAVIPDSFLELEDVRIK